MVWRQPASPPRDDSRQPRRGGRGGGHSLLLERRLGPGTGTGPSTDVDPDTAAGQDARRVRPTRQPASEPSGAAATPKLDVVATVNGEKITREDLARECLRHYGKDVLESLVNLYLIRQECERLGLSVTRQEVDEEIERLAKRFGLPVEQWYKMLKQERGIDPAQYATDIVWPTLALRKLAGERLKVTPEEFQEAYEMQYGPAIKARLIAVKDPAKAKELHAKAVAAPETFGDLAKNHSEDTPSASDNGWIPPIRKHAGHEEIEQAVFSMKDGEISPVIQVAGQCVILKREEAMPGRNVEFDLVKPNLEKFIEERKLRTVAHDVFRELQERAKVENYFNDPAKRDTGIAAVLNGRQITVRTLAEECITRHGEEVLEGTINRKLLEQACKKRGIDGDRRRPGGRGSPRGGDVGRPAARTGSPTSRPGSPWPPSGKASRATCTIRDSVWPSVALMKLSEGDVSITEEDIEKGFEANYGPRVRCLAIVLDDLRRASRSGEWPERNRPPRTSATWPSNTRSSRAARSSAGQVPPIRKHGGQPVLEKEAFALAPGEISGIIQADDKYVILFCEGQTETGQGRARNEVRALIVEDLREKKLHAGHGQVLPAVAGPRGDRQLPLRQVAVALAGRQAGPERPQPRTGACRWNSARGPAGVARPPGRTRGRRAALIRLLVPRGGAVEAAEVDAAADLLLQELDPRFEPFEVALEAQQDHLLGRSLLGTRHGGIAEVALQGREQKQRVLAAVGQGDLAFLLAEQDRFFRAAAPLGVVLAADVDHVGEVDQSDLPADGLDPLAPVVVVDRVGGDGHEALVVAQPVAAKRLELVEEHALLGGLLRAVLGVALGGFPARRGSRTARPRPPPRRRRRSETARSSAPDCRIAVANPPVNCSSWAMYSRAMGSFVVARISWRMATSRSCVEMANCIRSASVRKK